MINKFYYVCTTWRPSGWAVTWACLFVKSVLQPDPLLERTDDPPAIACLISALITICEPIYHVSHALRTVLADAPGATRRAQKRYPRAWRFWHSRLPHLLCHGSPTALQVVSSWPTRHYARLAFTTTLANTASLRDSRHFVIQVDEFIIFVNLSNQTCVLPPWSQFM